MATTPARTRPAGTFDAARWIADWTEHGGIYIVAGEQLHLRRVRPLDLYSTLCLDCLRDDLLRSGGGPAVADAVIKRQNDEVA